MRDDAAAGGDSNPGVPPFPPEIHLKTPSPANAEQRAALLELRDLLEKSHNASYNYARSWCTDAQLVRFLVARNYHIPRAFVLTLSACEWRATRKPSEIERQPGWEDMIRHECETGKIYCPGYDRWHRPVIIFDNSVQNTHSHDAHILFLAWNLELGTRMMPPDVDKYVILINLQHFSLRNNPTLQTTKETIKMLCDCFPERLGHLICYQPPWIFKGVFEAVKIFIDPKTVSKVRAFHSFITLALRSTGPEQTRVVGRCTSWWGTTPTARRTTR